PAARRPGGPGGDVFGRRIYGVARRAFDGARARCLAAGTDGAGDAGISVLSARRSDRPRLHAVSRVWASRIWSAVPSRGHAPADAVGRARADATCAAGYRTHSADGDGSREQQHSAAAAEPVRQPLRRSTAVAWTQLRPRVPHARLNHFRRARLAGGGPGV